MTSSDPTARDELVAAYLDNEATPVERAQVEADPELVDRVETMRQIAALVGEPVVPPPTHIRDRHIAEALAVSTTAANVTSVTARRRWSPDYTRVLSAAAVILVALLAGSLVLLNTSSDDDDATTAAGVFQADDVAEAEEADIADDGVANTTEAPPADEAMSDEESEADEEMTSEEPMADEGDSGFETSTASEGDTAVEAETAAPDEAGATGPTLFDSVDYLASGDFADTTALADSLGELLDTDPLLADSESARSATGSACGDTLDLLVGVNQQPVLVGDATVAGVEVEWVLIDTLEGLRLTLVDTATCGVFDDVELE